MQEVNAVEAGVLKEVIPDLVVPSIASPFKLYRYDLGSDRYYMTIDESGHVSQYFMSATVFAKKALSTSPFLIEWIKKHGSLADNLRDERSNYGTTMHMAVSHCLKEGRVNFDELRTMAMESAGVHGWPEQAIRWAYDLTKDVASFFAFFQERVVEVLAIEFPIASKKHGVAGTIDMVVKLRWRGKIIICIIDLKSGRKGFWEVHELQLCLYKLMWNEWYGGIVPVTHIFNWSPKDWRGETPTYDLENQTNTKYSRTLHSRLRIAKHEEWLQPPSEKVWLEGSFDVRKFLPENHIRKLSFKETPKPLFQDEEE